jgi:hypothetical protein
LQSCTTDPCSAYHKEPCSNADTRLETRIPKPWPARTFETRQDPAFWYSGCMETPTPKILYHSQLILMPCPQFLSEVGHAYCTLSVFFLSACIRAIQCIAPVSSERCYLADVQENSSPIDGYMRRHRRLKASAISKDVTVSVVKFCWFPFQVYTSPTPLKLASQYPCCCLL